jgi:hypothetical protein
MSRLRPKRFTREQEVALEESERLMARVQIYRAGVREALSLDYPGPYDLDTAIKVLEESRHLEDAARRKRVPLEVEAPGKAKRTNRNGGKR